MWRWEPTHRLQIAELRASRFTLAAAGVVAIRLRLVPLPSLDAPVPGTACVGIRSSTPPTVFEPLRRELEEPGLTAGRHLVLEVRTTEGQLDRLQARVVVVAPGPRGVNPADLPIEHSRQYEPVVNLPAARAIQLGRPQSLLARTDHAIE